MEKHYEGSIAFRYGFFLRERYIFLDKTIRDSKNQKFRENLLKDHDRFWIPSVNKADLLTRYHQEAI